MIISKFPFTRQLLLVAMVMSVAVNQGDAQQEKQPPLSLQLSVVVDPKNPEVMLAYTVTNHSNQELEVEGVGVGNSPIIITTPSAGEIADFVIVERTVPLPKLKPGETRVTKLSAGGTLDANRLFRAGVYRLRWQVALIDEDDEVVTYKSNEIPFLREKGTVAYDPIMGKKVEIQ